MNTRPRRRNADTTQTETTYKQVNGVRGAAAEARGGRRRASGRARHAGWTMDHAKAHTHFRTARRMRQHDRYGLNAADDRVLGIPQSEPLACSSISVVVVLLTRILDANVQ